VVLQTIFQAAAQFGINAANLGEISRALLRWQIQGGGKDNAFRLVGNVH